MFYQEEVAQWTQTVSKHMSHLSRSQANVLALWSYAMGFTQRCGRTTVGAWLAQAVGGSEDAWRQRLREWCYDAVDKKGHKRTQVEVQACFGDLLEWVIACWPKDERRLALALDASPLAERFVVLSISVLYQGSAIAVAWRVVRAKEKGEWQAIWLALLDRLAGHIPTDWTVLMLADRGLYAHWLYERIQQLGWHPFLRINQQGKVRKLGCSEFESLGGLLTEPGTRWSGQVSCFADRKARLECTLVARWDDGHREPWLIVTDLDHQQAEGAWYRMRFWIECGFKGSKSAGWHWHCTRMTDPRRAERLLAVLAVAQLRTMSAAHPPKGRSSQPDMEHLPSTHIARRLLKPERAPRAPELSCQQRGLIDLQVAALRGVPLVLRPLAPAAWPITAPPARKLSDDKQQQREKARLRDLLTKRRARRRRRSRACATARVA